MTNKAIYNSTIEIGLRILILLVCKEVNSYNLDKLVYFDYLLTHSGDIDNTQDSILPNSPYRFFEFQVNKEKIVKAIDMLWKKGLIDVEYKSNGIFYKANRLTKVLTDNLKSKMANSLKEKAVWVINSFYSISEKQLNDIFYKELKNKSFSSQSIRMA